MVQSEQPSAFDVPEAAFTSTAASIGAAEARPAPWPGEIVVGMAGIKPIKG